MYIVKRYYLTSNPLTKSSSQPDDGVVLATESLAYTVSAAIDN
jgi:hypothetical protein